MDGSPADLHSMQSNERQDVRARSERVVAQARALIERCARVSEVHQLQRIRHAETMAALAELRVGLRGLVVDYSRTLRQLEVPPESAVVLVKQLVDDPERRLPADVVVELRHEAVTWAVEAYYAA